MKLFLHKTSCRRGSQAREMDAPEIHESTFRLVMTPVNAVNGESRALVVASVVDGHVARVSNIVERLLSQSYSCSPHCSPLCSLEITSLVRLHQGFKRFFTMFFSTTAVDPGQRFHIYDEMRRYQVQLVDRIARYSTPCLLQISPDPIPVHIRPSF